MELLAPAGSPEALVAAVQGGADAVYLGFGPLNARRNAKNFTEEQLEEAVAYCHLRGVRVYLTLNTLLQNRELAMAAETGALAALRVPDDLRVGPVRHAGSRDCHLDDGGVRGDAVHDLGHDLLQHSPQAPGSDAPGHRPVGHRLQGLPAELQHHLVIVQQLLILLHQGVFGLSEDLNHLLPVQ